MFSGGPQQYNVNKQLCSSYGDYSDSFSLETFIDNGERSNIQDCISACCNSPSCDIALMNGKRCFSVQCGRNTTTCQEVRAGSSLSRSTLAYVTRYIDAEHEQG